MALNFYFEGLNQSLQMDVCGQLEETSLTLPVINTDVSAIAVLYVPTDNMRSVFKFQSDSTDITDASAADVIFHISDGSWNDLSANEVNAARAMLHDATYSDGELEHYSAANNKRLVKHDFVRNIAKQLFNTTAGVDLFNNEADLLSNIEEKWDACQTNILTQLGNANGLTSGTGHSDASSNIGNQMLEHIAANAPERFIVGTTDATIRDMSGVQSFPLQANDTINFKLTITGEGNNHNLVSLGSAVGSRSYLIKLVLTDGATDVTVNTGADNTDSQ